MKYTTLIINTARMKSASLPCGTDSTKISVRSIIFIHTYIYWIFSIDLILPAALGPGVYSASNRNEYQELIK
jgi:hypothetical protein